MRIRGITKSTIGYNSANGRGFRPGFPRANSPALPVRRQSCARIARRPIGWKEVEYFFFGEHVMQTLGIIGL
jgi:hypothetical protein